MVTRNALSATVAAAVAACIGFSVTPASAEDFYKDKQVELTIGANPGGGYDSYARLTGRFIEAHIPGKPTIIPRNRPGAGSRKALQWFYDGAPTDGMVFGAFYPSVFTDPLINAKRSKYDVTKLAYLGSTNKTARQCIGRKDAKVQKFEDLFKHELLIGATASGGSTRDYAIMMNRLLGTKFKVISGYKGSKGILLSIDRGETQGLCGYAWSSLSKAKPEWAAGKEVNILVQMNLKPHAEMTKLGAPMIWDYAKTQLQKDVIAFFLKQQEFGRPYLMPPGTPKEAVAIMEKAIMATWNSKEFKVAAEKVNLDVEPIDGAEMQKLVKELYASPKEVLSEVRAIMHNPKKKKKKS